MTFSKTAVGVQSLNLSQTEQNLNQSIFSKQMKENYEGIK